jgi:hypothetical protein
LTSLELLNNAKDILSLADAVLAKTASDDAETTDSLSSGGLQDLSENSSDKLAVTADFVFNNRASPLHVALAVGCFVADVVATKMVCLNTFNKIF